MAEIRENGEYFQVSLIADESGKPFWEMQTAWVGWESLEPRIEKREISAVKPDVMIGFWEKLRLPYVIINTDIEAIRFFMTGGHALIEKAQIDNFFRSLTVATPARIHGDIGFVNASDMPSVGFQRAPTRKLRMDVMRRDSYRCKLCGRRPADYVDIELHIHHIRPWGDGGATMEDNLITLCSTCHTGLEPHFDPNLFELLKLKKITTLDEYRARHIEGVLRYRKYAARRYQEETAEHPEPTDSN